jgi:SAM-dependent methyltransferase
MLSALINRAQHVTQWQKIPWHEEAFSQRMLKEHLDQSHELASRRQANISKHIVWMHNTILQQQPSRILDLGCGPGFYVQRLAELGHTVRGMDFSPASIAYAREQHPDGDYVQADILQADYGEGYDFLTMIYGELNAFAKEEAQHIINKAYHALKTGGKLLLEVHPFAFVQELGNQAPSWYTAQQSLFSDKPHLVLTEAYFDIDHMATRIYVFDGETAEMTPYTTMLQAYTQDEYANLLKTFSRITWYASLTGEEDNSNLNVVVAEK